jgi:hypothetical protein
MGEVCSLIWLALVGAFRSRASLEAENTICAISLTCAAAIADGIAAINCTTDSKPRTALRNVYNLTVRFGETV